MFPSRRTFPKWLALAAAITLVGCGATTQPVVKHDTVLLVPDDSLLLDCPVAAPPAKNDYVLLTAKEKEKALAEYGNQQTKNIGLCNNDKAGLRKWKKDQLERENRKRAVKGTIE